MPIISDWERPFIQDRRVARLATVDSDGQPHAVPIVYGFDGQRLYTPIDEKPKRVGAYQLQRVRNIQVNHRVAVIIDEYSENWDQLAWVQIRGEAKIITNGEVYDSGVQLLASKYHQYKEMPLAGRPVILIAPDKVTSWRAKSPES